MYFIHIDLKYGRCLREISNKSTFLMDRNLQYLYGKCQPHGSLRQVTLTRYIHRNRMQPVKIHLSIDAVTDTTHSILCSSLPPPFSESLRVVRNLSKEEKYSEIMLRIGTAKVVSPSLSTASCHWGVKMEASDQFYGLADFMYYGRKPPFILYKF
jgi:hypothetical protein